MAGPGEVMDMEKCQQLAKLVEQMTTSGKPVLPENELKALKKICRQSDAYVKHCFYLVMTQLEKDHSEIRLSSLLIIDEIFNRSHCFRDLLLKDFQNFLELTLETDPELPLPPPKQAADILKRKTMRTVHQWHSKFGDSYKKLSLGYNFLKHCKKIDFESMEARSEAERRQKQRDRERAGLLEKQLVENATQQMKEMKEEFKQNLLQAENCMRLLLPEPESFNINGLKSPDPHRTTNPWQNYRRASFESRRKSSDLKHSHKQSAIPAISVSQENRKNVKVKGANVDSNVKTEGLTSDSSQTEMVSLQNQVKTEPGSDDTSSSLSAVKSNGLSSQVTVDALTEQAGCSSSNKVDVDGDSDDFQEITDSSDSSSDEEVDGSYDAEEMLQTSATMELVRTHGLGSRQYHLSIELPPDEVHIEETEDNEDIINALRDSFQLAQNKFLPSLQKWIEIFTKAGKQHLIRRALDIKNVITNMTEKVGKLKFVRNKKVKSQRRKSGAKVGSDDSDDDFEEVEEKEGFEPRIPDHLREEYGLVDKIQKPATEKEWSLKNREDLAEDPTSISATLKKLKNPMDDDLKSDQSVTPGTEEMKVKVETPGKVQTANTESEPSSSTRDLEHLRQKAPHIPFNTDLAHWGKKIETPLVAKFESSSRFWLPKDNSEEDVVDKGALSAMTSRVISFAGNFEPVKHQCRAPLPNGKLCPRRDRFKCPFHGKIIPRDPVGQPYNPEDKLQEEEEKEKKQQEGVPDWEDPDLQQEIQAATGVDVTRKSKGKGKGKGKGKQKARKKYPELTDISPQPKTARGRLESKVLSVKAIKRVASALDAQDSKRHKDKFGNQFNYALKNRA